MSNFIDSIYACSPIWLQQTMISIYGWWWFRKRYGNSFYKMLSELLSREKWTRQQFLLFQEQKLKELLLTANNSPYYNQIFKINHVDFSRPSFEILRQLPFLTKETFRNHSKDLLTSSKIPRDTSIFKTSGTTGTPIAVYYTPEFHQLELAVSAGRNLRWAGVDQHSRRVMFGVRKVCNYNQATPPFWRYSPKENLAYASIYHLSPDFLPSYLEFLRQFRPEIIMGYPSVLYTIACYAIEHNDFPEPAKVVVTTSETVTPKIREAIETAWQCRIFDRYGAVEGCVFASQCEYGKYHISPDVGIVEIIDREGNNVTHGQFGEVTCTGLYNTLQPLIRYKIGDVARWAEDQSCLCGRSMPIIDGIEGRFEDICYTPDGRQLLRFDTVFKGINGIREAQIVQEKLDTFLIYIVPAIGFSDQDKTMIKHNMELHVGKINIKIIPVSNIPRTKNGKFRAVICKLPINQIIR